MATKITLEAKEEIIEALVEMEQEADEEWAENEWYEDEELFRPEPIDYCPECGDSPYLRGTTCSTTGDFIIMNFPVMIVS